MCRGEEGEEGKEEEEEVDVATEWLPSSPLLLLLLHGTHANYQPYSTTVIVIVSSHVGHSAAVHSRTEGAAAVIATMTSTW